MKKVKVREGSIAYWIVNAGKIALLPLAISSIYFLFYMIYM